MVHNSVAWMVVLSRGNTATGADGDVDGEDEAVEGTGGNAK